MQDPESVAELILVYRLASNIVINKIQQQIKLNSFINSTMFNKLSHKDAQKLVTMSFMSLKKSLLSSFWKLATSV